MSAPHARPWTLTHATEAWHALAEHGSVKAAADALGVRPPVVNKRVVTYRKMHGLPSLAKPWDLSGRLVLVCSACKPGKTTASFDLLLEALEHAETAGDRVHAEHVRLHLRRLEARYYGQGLEPLPRRLR